MTLGCAAASQAHAESWFQFEAGLGAARYQKADDNTWYQSGLGGNVRVNVPAFRVGIQLNAIEPQGWRPGVAFHLAYLDLGHMGVSSPAAPDQSGRYKSQGYYNIATHACEGPCGPERQFESGGHMQLVALTIEPYWRVNQWRFGAEAGPALIHYQWNVTARNIDNTPDWGPRGTVEHMWANPHWELGAIAGVSVGYGRVTLRYDYIYAHERNMGGWDQNGAHATNLVPVGWIGAHMVSVNYAF
jgi:hypothetical protein